jgi:hypothetical protein
MSTCSTSEALELLLKGRVACHAVEFLPARCALGKSLRLKAGFDPSIDAARLLLHGAVSLDGAKVSDPVLRIDLIAGETLLVRAGRLKLQRWVIQ